MVKGIKSLKKTNTLSNKSKKKRSRRVSNKTKAKTNYFKFRLYTNNSFVKYNKIKII